MDQAQPNNKTSPAVLMRKSIKCLQDEWKGCRPIESGWEGGVGVEQVERTCSLLQAWPQISGKEVYFWSNLGLRFHYTLAEIHPRAMGMLPLNACGGARDDY